jgi:hypothetical protein
MSNLIIKDLPKYWQLEYMFLSQIDPRSLMSFRVNEFAFEHTRQPTSEEIVVRVTFNRHNENLPIIEFNDRFKNIIENSTCVYLTITQGVETRPAKFSVNRLVENDVSFKRIANLGSNKVNRLSIFGRNNRLMTDYSDFVDDYIELRDFTHTYLDPQINSRKKTKWISSHLLLQLVLESIFMNVSEFWHNEEWGFNNIIVDEKGAFYFKKYALSIVYDYLYEKYYDGDFLNTEEGKVIIDELLTSCSLDNYYYIRKFDPDDDWS